MPRRQRLLKRRPKQRTPNGEHAPTLGAGRRACEDGRRASGASRRRTKPRRRDPGGAAAERSRCYRSIDFASAEADACSGRSRSRDARRARDDRGLAARPSAGRAPPARSRAARPPPPSRAPARSRPKASPQAKRRCRRSDGQAVAADATPPADGERKERHGRPRHRRRDRGPTQGWRRQGRRRAGRRRQSQRKQAATRTGRSAGGSAATAGAARASSGARRPAAAPGSWRSWPRRDRDRDRGRGDDKGRTAIWAPSEPPRGNKEPDPNSPFAKLLALKEQLEGNKDRTELQLSVRPDLDRQRIDKWLWHARVVRTRSAAAALANSGLVRINGARIDTSSRPVRPGDVVTVALDRNVRILKVIGFAERRGSAEIARALYEDLTPPPRRRRSPAAASGTRAPAARPSGSAARSTGCRAATSSISATNRPFGGSRLRDAPPMRYGAPFSGVME